MKLDELRKLRPEKQRKWAHDCSLNDFRAIVSAIAQGLKDVEAEETQEQRTEFFNLALLLGRVNQGRFS